MVNLAIDFGNTRTKAAIFDDDQIIYLTDSFNLHDLDAIHAQFQPSHTIISSVSMSKESIQQRFGPDILLLTHQTKLPYKVLYKTPETLGLDRIAAVAGAQFLFPGKNCLVVDAGTCITYDFIDTESQHHGGSISPGLTIRFKALNTFTANLPLVEYSEDSPFIGQTTKEAIKSGVIFGLMAEIEGIIRMYNDKYADLQIIMCGGDAKFFEKKLKATIFATPELVLTGLNRILQYNV